MKRDYFAVSMIVVGAMLISGCATAQGEDPALAQARQAVTQAQNDPVVVENASVPLYEAQQALQKAQKAESDDERRHYAMMAQKRVELARTLAQNEQDKQEIDRLSQQQQQILLQARSQETQQAQQEIQEAQQQAQQAREQLQQFETEQSQARTQRLEQELSRLRTQQMQQTSRGIMLTMDDVLFETGSAELKTGALRNLSQLAAVLKAHPGSQIIIEGYTDNTGPADYNLRLSEQRAESVAQALIVQGVEPDRVIVRGYGQQFPVASNENPAGRQANRRVQIVIPQDSRGYQPPQDAAQGPTG